MLNWPLLFENKLMGEKKSVRHWVSGVGFLPVENCEFGPPVTSGGRDAVTIFKATPSHASLRQTPTPRVLILDFGF